ncbi:MAG: hypothetical protein JSR66_07040 [Proteobacteria bacterium]|nr:hypothetical protein [Pseudomonadota bacterium]
MRHFVTPLVLISAGICYAIGFDGAVFAAVLAAMGLELLFWTRIARFGRPIRNR